MQTLVITSDPGRWKDFEPFGYKATVGQAFGSGEELVISPEIQIRDFSLIVISDITALDDGVETDELARQYESATEALYELYDSGEHAKFVLFGDPGCLRPQLPWPRDAKLVSGPPGTTFEYSDHALASILERNGQNRYTISWGDSDCVPLAHNNAGRVVAAIDYRKLFLPMVDGDRPRFLRTLLETPPIWAPAAVPVESSSAPEWVGKRTWPALDQRKLELSEAEEAAAAAFERRAASEQAFEQEEAWGELLWAGGARLEDVATAAMRELGLPAESTGESGREDMRIELEDRIVLVEVKGRTGEAQIVDGRQLDDWVQSEVVGQLESGEKKDVHGVLLVCSHRETDLSERPTRVFSEHLKTYAAGRGLLLRTTSEVFDIVTNVSSDRELSARRLLGLNE